MTRKNKSKTPVEIKRELIAAAKTAKDPLQRAVIYAELQHPALRDLEV